MKKNIFDVLVVYSEKIARSASTKSATTPFLSSNRAQYNYAYEYFLNICMQNGLRAAFATAKDVTGAGKINSYWVFENKKWLKVERTAYSSLIFDKFSPLNKYYKNKSSVLFSSKKVKPFNNEYLHKLFDDKQATFDKFHTYSVPTVSLNSYSYTGISKSIKDIEKLIIGNRDFSDAFILKDKYGAGGENIYIISDNFPKRILDIVKHNTKNSFILQPFVMFDKGYKYKKIPTATDIRIIFQNGKIIQTYIRMARKNDFRCNEHQGGTVKYVSLKDIPKEVIIRSKEIVKILGKKNTLFALDFIVSNSGNIYLLEGNINPGIYWSENSTEDEKNTKILIHYIVKEIKARTLLHKPKVAIKKKVELDILPMPQIIETATLSNTYN